MKNFCLALFLILPYFFSGQENPKDITADLKVDNAILDTTYRAIFYDTVALKNNLRLSEKKITKRRNHFF